MLAYDNLIILICVSCFFLTHTVSLHVLFSGSSSKDPKRSVLEL